MEQISKTIDSISAWASNNPVQAGSLITFVILLIIILIVMSRSSKKAEPKSKAKEKLIPGNFVINKRILEHIQDAVENNKEKSFGVILRDLSIITYSHSGGRRTVIDPVTRENHIILKDVEGAVFDAR